jgi:hypothetical protein
MSYEVMGRSLFSGSIHAIWIASGAYETMVGIAGDSGVLAANTDKAELKSDSPIALYASTLNW